MAQEFRLIGLTNPPKSAGEEMVDHEYIDDDDERRLIKRYLELGDPNGRKRQPPFPLRQKWRRPKN
jgi:hypothetical protein